MSTNYHTAITTGAAANASTVNSPLGELDAGITALATLNGVTVSKLYDSDGGAVAVTVDAGGTMSALKGINTVAVSNIANDATYDITTNLYAGWLIITNKLGYANQCGIIAFRNASGSLRQNIVLNPNSDLSVTVDNAATVNIYCPSVNTIRIQNKTGGAIYPSITLIGVGS